MPKITSIKPQKRGNRVNIFLDNKFAFGLDLENLLKYNLKIEKELSEKEVEKIVNEAEFAKIWNNLLKFATLRPRSQKEVFDWFRRKKVHASLHNKLTKKLRKLEFINDEKFAHWWVEQRTTFKLQSKKALYFELLKKGIAKELIDEAINKQEINEVEVAKSLIKKRRLEGPKAAQYLARKGFSWEVVKEVLNC